ncbi:hypothetical protein BGW36DRAFT_416614 [Talaromyces proteolyticus]|uniref:Integral membrane protein n=1 Tax=Talaromyces proteolyticus TaxID=1131652 RepID=A0AAD4KXY6_9EURO|nr:uncharacterized protein BGW36DRAFT_416614 [Talaromyces proteolyticus]KAH8699318.1 hypothetical protein BGW36DRAFT_416614 [Talaromyces proteolyticus]
MNMDMDHGNNNSFEHNPDVGATIDAADWPESYFAHGQHTCVNLGHIAREVIAWFFFLPIVITGAMHSITRSRLALLVQFLFLVINVFGLLLGAMCAEVVMGLLFTYSDRNKPSNTRSLDSGNAYENTAFLPVAVSEPADDQDSSRIYCWSCDSGQGTEPMWSTLHSRQTFLESGGLRLSPYVDDDDEDYAEKIGDDPIDGCLGQLLRLARVDSFLSALVLGLISRRMMGALGVIYVVIERMIMLFRFIAIATGAVTYGGIIRGSNVFNGLAHFIKGGIFFWYGILTCGRWMGSFADFGWAWNIKPSRSVVGEWAAHAPSGEFTESFVIFLYGVTDDLEHVSISILFFGGGLCGMLIESQGVHTWINTGIYHSPTVLTQQYSPQTYAQPPTQRISLNPMPLLIIMLLGLMIIVTYLVLCVRPPESLLPYRPPSELVASFCLIAGGLIFMLSTKDIIVAMEYVELNAIFVFTIGMGFSALVMAYEMLCISLKAWAAPRTPLPTPSTSAAAVEREHSQE